jgi:hypothetical protein
MAVSGRSLKAELASLRYVEYKHGQDQLAILVAVAVKDVPETALMRQFDSAL